MAILNQKRILNLIPKTSAPVTIHVSQGDVGTEIEFTLVKGDELFVNTGNLTASVHGVREDGANFGTFACTLSGSSVKFPLHSEMTMVKGSAIAEIVLVDSQGNKVGSANFGIMVEESVFPLGVTYDNDVSVYESILAYVQTIPAQVTQDYNTKINAETAARQAADSSLNEALANVANSVSEEATTRAAADTALGARIDNIIAPSGEAPSAAEVTDARVGADGTTYNTLGTAIRTQVGNLQTKLEEIRTDLVGVTSAQWNLAGTTIAGSPSNRCKVFNCLPNTEYVIKRKIITHHFVVGTTQATPTIGSSILQKVINNDGDTISIKTNENAYGLVVWFYNTNDDGSIATESNAYNDIVAFNSDVYFDTNENTLAIAKLNGDVNDINTSIDNGFGVDIVTSTQRSGLQAIQPINGNFSSSPSNRMMVVACEANTEYAIKRALKTTRMVVCQSDVSVTSSSAYHDLYEWKSEDDDVTYVKTGSNTLYLVLGLWNSTNDSSINVTDFFNGLSVHERRYANVYHEIEKNAAEIININELISNLRYDSSKNYFAQVFNNTSEDYNNYPIQIKACFEKGECKGKNYIRVFNSSDVEMPFQIDEIVDANFLINKNYSYYEDGSLKAITIWIVDTISANGSKTYRVAIYNKPQTYAFTKQVTDSYTSSDAYTSSSTSTFVVVANSITYLFNRTGITGYGDHVGGSTRNRNVINYNGNNISCESGYNYDSIVRSGSGVIFTDIDFTWSYGTITFTEKYRIFKNGMIYSMSTLHSSADISEDVLTSWYCQKSVNAEAGASYAPVTSGAEAFGFRVVFGDNSKWDFIGDFETTNSARATSASAFPKINEKYIAGMDRDSSQVPLSFLVILGLEPTSWIPAEMKLYISMWIYPNVGSENNVIKTQYKLIGVCTSEVAQFNIEKLKEKTRAHLNFLGKYLAHKYPNGTSGTTDAILDIYYYQYKTQHTRTLDEVIALIRDLYPNTESGMTIYETFVAHTTSVYNGEYLGKIFMVFLYLYYDSLAEGHDDYAEYLADFMTKIGDFYAIAYGIHGDLPIHVHGDHDFVFNNNGRASALCCLAQAMMFAEDTTDMQIAWEGGIAKLEDNSMLEGTCINDENITTQRYLHYEAYAVAKLLMAYALKRATPTTDYVHRLLDYVTASGQIRDDEMESSTERKGLGTSYIYMIICMMAIGDASAAKMALDIANAYFANDLLDGTRPYPLDYYSSNLAYSNVEVGSTQEIMELYNILYFADRF